MIKQTIGFILLCIGAMGGDSERLWLPIFLVLLGVVLLYERKD